MERTSEHLIVAIALIIFFLFIGTIFFHIVEGWRFIDAFYYTGITITTVGYGDFIPSHDISKIISVLLAFSGIGIVFYSVTVLAEKYFERQAKRIQTLREKHAGHDHFKIFRKPFSKLLSKKIVPKIN